MVAYNRTYFDRVIDRNGTESTKWDRHACGLDTSRDQLPLWLADMDFATSEEITAALMARAAHPIYGYTDRGPQYQELFAERFSSTHGGVNPDQVVLSTGVMYSIAAALEEFTRPGDGVLIMKPCYHPFVVTTEQLGRTPIYVSLIDTERGFEIDEDALDKAAASCRALLLCNPHNPTGRVFSVKELCYFGAVCERYGLVAISDEIHCDFVYGPNVFTSLAAVSPYAREHGVCCVSPTKSFNLAGLKVSAAIINNQSMFDRFRTRAKVTGINSINLFAMEAIKAAYRQSNDWQHSLLSYLEGNRELIARFVDESSDYVHAHTPEGTYFFWLHFPGQRDAALHLASDEGVILSPGTDFDARLSEWARLNFACPRSVLSEALVRIRRWGGDQQERLVR